MRKKIVTVMLACALSIGCNTVKKQSRLQSETILVEDKAAEKTEGKINPVPAFDDIQLKYGKMLDVSPAAITNRQLYGFIDKWINTPYKWGGTDKRGIDCSAFLQRLFAEVYAVQIPRTSVQQFFARQIEPYASAKYLSEGDLVFFRTLNNTTVSHVGVYLHNRMFVNSCSSKGVCIESLETPYWKSKYVAAGRLRPVQTIKKQQSASRTL